MWRAALKNGGRRRSLPPGNASHAQFRGTTSRCSSGGRRHQWQGDTAEKASPAFTIDRNGDDLGSRFETTFHDLDAEALAMLRRA